VKTRALTVVLNLFKELQKPSADVIDIDPLDYRVAQAYIMPLFKQQTDTFKPDQGNSELALRLCTAQNLGKLARVSMRFLEISVGSATRRRQESLRRSSSL
jgi:hypothetical protein